MTPTLKGLVLKSGDMLRIEHEVSGEEDRITKVEVVPAMTPTPEQIEAAAKILGVTPDEMKAALMSPAAAGVGKNKVPAISYAAFKAAIDSTIDRCAEVAKAFKVNTDDPRSAQEQLEGELLALKSNG